MPPRRSTRTNARKQTPIPYAKSTPKSAANDSPSSTTPTTTSEPSFSPTIETTPIISPNFTANVSGQDSTQVPMVKPSEAAIEAEDSKSTQEITFPAPIDEKITVTCPSVGIDEVVPSETLSETAPVKNPNCSDTLDAKDSPQPEMAANTAVVSENVDGSGQETAIKGKTVVKKRVRIVKKLVKKKVPKRVVNGGMEERAEMGIDGENPNPRVLGGTEAESPNPVESVPMEIKDHNAVENSQSNASVSMEAGMAKDGLNPSPSVLGGTEGENPNPVESVSMEVENHNADCSISVSKDVENSQAKVPLLMEAENSEHNLGASVSMEVENLDTHVSIQEKPEACEGEEDDSLTANVSGPLNSVAAKNSQSENTLSVTETHLDDESSIQERNKEFENEKLDSRCWGEEEGVKEEVRNCEVSGLKEEVRMCDVVLSGEMEALERRRKRRTEIFIGGLDKNAKEDDIRKVFGEVGVIVDVRLVMDGITGKNKGFAFVRFGSAADAKKALEKYSKVKICGKQCGASLVEGNDTLFLGNIDKHWKSEDILKLLQGIGIEKIDKVTVVADPNKLECNRGFAFLELETCKDAQNAYMKLQKKDVFGKHQKIKVAWAEPLQEPNEKEMLKAKSVYAEYIPSSWSEEDVRNYFKKFGEIENVALARNLGSSKRKDFAFVNYTTREAALACIEAFSRESFNDDGSKVNVKVSLAKPLPKGKEIKPSLAKPIPKGKEIKPVSNPISKDSSKAKLKVAQSVTRPHESRNKGKSSSSGYENVRFDKRSSTTAELVQLLREQASWTQSRTSSHIGSLDRDYPYPSPGRKRQFSGDGPVYSDLRGHPRTRLESSLPTTRLSYGELSQGVGATSLPYYHPQSDGYASGSLGGIEDYTNSYQTRRAPYGGSLYHRFQ